MASTTQGDQQQDITHTDWCDTAAHTDPAFDCASPVDDTHGVLTHTAATTDGPRAYAELRAAPLALTAAACIDLAARFSHLAHVLTHR